MNSVPLHSWLCLYLVLNVSDFEFHTGPILRCKSIWRESKFTSWKSFALSSGWCISMTCGLSDANIRKFKFLFKYSLCTVYFEIRFPKLHLLLHKIHVRDHHLHRDFGSQILTLLGHNLFSLKHIVFINKLLLPKIVNYQKGEHTSVIRLVIV